MAADSVADLKPALSGQKTIIQVLGPTGVGKSQVAVHLAKQFFGEIISADSIQVYRDFNIGTAKISLSEQQGVVHHLLSAIEPTCQYNASMFLQDSWQAVQKIEKNGRLPLVCGGTALYLRVMKYGIFPQANDGGVVRRELQKSVEVLGLQSLWQMLHDIDAGYAQKIGPNDQKRIIRALEIYKINGIPPSEIFKQTATPFQYYQFIRIGLNLDREVLYQRINQRVDEMIKNGLINEIERLRQRYPASCPPFASVGYKEIIQFLQGQMDLHSAVDLIKQHTRNYAKRQLSWFRQEKDIHWFEPGQQQKMADFIKEQIGH